MLEIEKARATQLRNEEWFQYVTEIKRLVEAEGIETQLSAEWNKFVELYKNADLVLEYIRKSSYTAEIEECDNQRDIIFSGFRDIVKGMQSHFDAQRQKAAINLMLVFNQYGNISQKGYRDETASIYNFLQEMRGKFSEYVTILGLSEWVDNLENYNIKFGNLILERNEEKSRKPKFNMREIRKELDICYGNITRCLEVATILNSSDSLTSLINKLNSNSGSYRNLLLQREGRAAAKKKVSPAPGEILDIPAKKTE
jgi:hypothetical protein